MSNTLKVGFNQGAPQLLASPAKYGVSMVPNLSAQGGSGTFVLPAAANLYGLALKPQTLTAPQTKKWTPGHYMDSLVFSYPGNLQESTKATEISVLRAGPTFVKGYNSYFTWPVFENTTQGVYDFSALDSEYVSVTGYSSGSGPGGTAVYTLPRLYCIYMLHDDYFDGTAVRICPAYIRASSSFGPSPTGGSFGWWTSTPGGTGSVIALWRNTSVAVRYAALFTAMGAHVLPDGWTVDTSPYVQWVKNSLETADIPQNVGGASFASADATYSTSNYLAGYGVLNSACQTAFPHTIYVTPSNFVGPTGNEDVTLMASLPGVKSGVGGPDVFGKSSGTNITPTGGETGLTFGQAAYIGLVPPGGGANPFFTPWVSGGTDQRGKIPYIATIQATEMGFESNYACLDLFNQVNDTLNATHASWSYVTSGSSGGKVPVGNQWTGNATSITQWMTNPGSWGGLLDMLFANSLTHIAYPSGF